MAGPEDRPADGHALNPDHIETDALLADPQVVVSEHPEGHIPTPSDICSTCGNGLVHINSDRDVAETLAEHRACVADESSCFDENCPKHGDQFDVSGENAGSDTPVSGFGTTPPTGSEREAGLRERLVALINDEADLRLPDGRLAIERERAVALIRYGAIR